MERTPDREWFEKVDSACSYVAHRKLQRLDPLREELIEVSRDARRFAAELDQAMEAVKETLDSESSTIGDTFRAGTFAGSPTHEPDDIDPHDDEGWLAAICPHGMVTGAAGYRTAEERAKMAELLAGSRTGRRVVEWGEGPTLQRCDLCFRFSLGNPDTFVESMTDEEAKEALRRLSASLVEEDRQARIEAALQLLFDECGPYWVAEKAKLELKRREAH